VAMEEGHLCRGHGRGPFVQTIADRLTNPIHLV
jgi:hypothetical protein